MKLKEEEGASLVEFALCSAVLFMSLFGIIALSGALYSYVFVSDAAREATRYAIVRGSSCKGFTDCDIQDLNSYVKNLGYPGINPANLSASASWPSGHAPGDVVIVTVNYTYPLNIPFWPKSGSLLNMSSTSQMVISQ
jgi:Flp pilus assembly protein TadG